MMLYLQVAIFFLCVTVFIVLALQGLYLFIFAIAGWLVKEKKYATAKDIGSFVIYIPSYKEDSVIVETAKAALNINYPTHKFHIVVIADSLQDTTLKALNALPIQVVKVDFEKSTKAKALNVALQQTQLVYDYALILDADNVCDSHALYKLNNVLNANFAVVQGQRLAKNTNTSFALLDAISEGINNHIFRKGHVALGLSAAIIGSGVALNFALFKSIMPQITAIGGFDKEMELQLLRKRIRFGYAQQALIYDEKITQQAHFESQRRRWLSAQLHYMQRYFLDGFVQLFKGNFDFFDKVIQTLLLPRILIIGIMPIMALLSIVIPTSLSPVYWFFLWIITYFSIFIAIPKSYFNKQLLTAIFSLPVAFLSMFKLFFKLKGANKTFIHTPHGETNNQKTI
jgi:cellulose synthase/poly-beta-1,6-N-acetylglucosamine synthase-like glycosyltransferase